jgi:hypothetical protein
VTFILADEATELGFAILDRLAGLRPPAVGSDVSETRINQD